MASDKNLDDLGLTHTGDIYWNLSTAALYEHAVRNGEAELSHYGPLIAMTTPHTGRSPSDKWVVQDDGNKDEVWWGPNNQPFDEAKFEPLFARTCAFAQGRDLYVQDLYAGADARYRLPVRFVTAYAWHSLFVRSLFIHPTAEELENHDPQFTVVNLSPFQADPAVDGTGTETFIVVNFARKLVVIGGTRYAGENKKSIFTVMNYLLPQQGVLPMHCSANVGSDGETALFFGLSGTGKTTPSMDPDRPLTGDDEPGWSAAGIFNFAGGCSAQPCNLSAEHEDGGPGLRGDHREHPRRLPADAVNERGSRRPGSPPAQRGVPGRRRVRRAAAHLAPYARPGHVPLPARLHRARGRHRARRHRA